MLGGPTSATLISGMFNLWPLQWFFSGFCLHLVPAMVHRDLKLENILTKEVEGDDLNIKASVHFPVKLNILSPIFL